MTLGTPRDVTSVLIEAREADTGEVSRTGKENA